STGRPGGSYGERDGGYTVDGTERCRQGTARHFKGKADRGRGYVDRRIHDISRYGRLLDYAVKNDRRHGKMAVSAGRHGGSQEVLRWMSNKWLPGFDTMLTSWTIRKRY